MIATAVVLCLVAQPEESLASRFFPLVAGEKRRYVTQEGAARVESMDQTLAELEIGDVKAFPVKTFSNGREIMTAYYRAESNALLLLGYDPKRLLAAPRPAFKIGSAKETWDWNGDEQGIPIEIQGESRLIGRRAVLGVERQVLEVKTRANLDPGPLLNRISQTAMYAEGLGLFEIKEERRTRREKTDRVVRLTAFEPAPEGNR